MSSYDQYAPDSTQKLRQRRELRGQLSTEQPVRGGPGRALPDREPDRDRGLQPVWAGHVGLRRPPDVAGRRPHDGPARICGPPVGQRLDARSAGHPLSGQPESVGEVAQQFHQSHVLHRQIDLRPGLNAHRHCVFIVLGWCHRDDDLQRRFAPTVQCRASPWSGDLHSFDTRTRCSFDRRRLQRRRPLSSQHLGTPD